MKKKWYVLLLAAVLPMLAASLVACDDDDDLPNVNIGIDVAQGTVVDDVIYVVQGDSIQIAAIDVVNNEEGKGAAVSNVTYYWDNIFYAPSVFSPFGMTFPITENVPLGKHVIGVSCSVLAVDKTLATAALTYPVMVVADAAEIPSGATGNQIVNSTSLTK